MQEEEYTIPQMVDDVRAGKMPRRQFIKTLSVMGISAAGIGAISTAAARSFISTPAYQEKLDKAVGAEKLTQLHDQHLEHQSQGNIDALQHDYALNAVVEDSMHRDPIVGISDLLQPALSGVAAWVDVERKNFSRAGRHSGWPCELYLRTVRSWPLVFRIAALGSRSLPRLPCVLAACLHSTPPRGGICTQFGTNR